MGNMKAIFSKLNGENNTDGVLSKLLSTRKRNNIPSSLSPFVTEDKEGYTSFENVARYPNEVVPVNKLSIFNEDMSSNRRVETNILEEVVKRQPVVLPEIIDNPKDRLDSMRTNIEELNLEIDLGLEEVMVEETIPEEKITKIEQEEEIEVEEEPEIEEPTLDIADDVDELDKEILGLGKDILEDKPNLMGSLFGGLKRKEPKRKKKGLTINPIPPKEEPVEEPLEEEPEGEPVKEKPFSIPQPNKSNSRGFKKRKKPEPPPMRVEEEDSEEEVEVTSSVESLLNSETFGIGDGLINKNSVIDGGGSDE